MQKHLHFILIDLLLKPTNRNDANNCIVNSWIACHATNLFKDIGGRPRSGWYLLSSQVSKGTKLTAANEQTREANHEAASDNKRSNNGMHQKIDESRLHMHRGFLGT